MTKEFWVNLPVKDIKKSKEFFAKIGFTINPVPGNTDDAASLVVGSKNIAVMLFSEPSFKTFSNNDIADNLSGTEVLFSFNAESREEVDELSVKVKEAGGKLYAGPGERDGWMYGCGFIDPDGHRWSVLHMDISKMPK